MNFLPSPTISSSNTDMVWSGSSIAKGPILEKMWLEVDVIDSDFIIVIARGILERVNPLLYEGSFFNGRHKLFLKEYNEKIKILVPAKIDGILKDIRYHGKFHHINAAVGRNEVSGLDSVTKENNTDMLEAHIGIQSKSTFEINFEIEVNYQKC